MKHLIKPFLVLLITFSSINEANSQKVITKYISNYYDLALNNMKKYSIPASIILGVSIVESGAGQSVLAKYFKNHFGIKGKNQNSKEKLGYKSSYKEYSTDSASYDHFCNVLMRKAFYQKLKGDKDYKEWLREMNNANYAEAKGVWVDKIMKAIKKYELYKYDKM